MSRIILYLFFQSGVVGDFFLGEDKNPAGDGHDNGDERADAAFGHKERFGGFGGSGFDKGGVAGVGVKPDFEAFVTGDADYFFEVFDLLSKLLFAMRAVVAFIAMHWLLLCFGTCQPMVASISFFMG